MEVDSRKNEAKNDMKQMDIEIEVNHSTRYNESTYRNCLVGCSEQVTR